MKKTIAVAAVLAFSSSAMADFFEDFNGGGAFPWTVVDYEAGGSFASPWDYNYNHIDGSDVRGNFTTGDGGAAHIDTDIRPSGSSGVYNMGMLSPETSIGANAELSYYICYRQLADEAGYVEISTDGGTTFDTLVTYTATIGGIPAVPYTADEALGAYETIDLSAYAGEDVIIQFRYAGDGWDWWMQVDDVFLTTTVPTPSALALLGLAGLARRRRR